MSLEYKKDYIQDTFEGLVDSKQFKSQLELHNEIFNKYTVATATTEHLEKLKKLEELDKLNQQKELERVGASAIDNFGIFNTTINSLNVSFEQKVYNNSITLKNIIFKNEKEEDLFQINIMQDDARNNYTKISLSIQGTVVENEKEIDSLLTAVSFDELLMNVNKNSSKLIEEQRKNLKTSTDLVSDVLSQINNMRQPKKLGSMSNTKN